MCLTRINKLSVSDHPRVLSCLGWGLIVILISRWLFWSYYSFLSNNTAFLVALLLEICVYNPLSVNIPLYDPCPWTTDPIWSQASPFDRFTYSYPWMNHRLRMGCWAFYLFFRWFVNHLFDFLGLVISWLMLSRFIGSPLVQFPLMVILCCFKLILNFTRSTGIRFMSNGTRLIGLALFSTILVFTLPFISIFTRSLWWPWRMALLGVMTITGSQIFESLPSLKAYLQHTLHLHLSSNFDDTVNSWVIFTWCDFYQQITPLLASFFLLLLITLFHSATLSFFSSCRFSVHPWPWLAVLVSLIWSSPATSLVSSLQTVGFLVHVHWLLTVLIIELIPCLFASLSLRSTALNSPILRKPPHALSVFWCLLSSFSGFSLFIVSNLILSTSSSH